jgi:glycosyltransferase involved in cell wall biosynthesis
LKPKGLKCIVHVIDSLQIGGAEILLYNTIKKLPGIKHHIIVLEPKIAFPDIDNYATIHVVNHQGWSSLLQSCRKIKKLVNEIQPDIIHSNLFLSSLLTRLALRAQRNIVYTLHTLYSPAIFKKLHLRLLEKYVYREQDKLIAISEGVLQDYKKTITKCKNGFVLYNFIDDCFFRYDRSEHEVNGSVLKKWIAVGSLKAVKNYQRMISLFKEYYDGLEDKNGAVLNIYGDGSLKEELQKLVDQLSVPVRIMGKATDIHLILDKYDAYISTSLYEGYGIAPMEALARGVPIFISDIPVYREVYQEHAFYFDVNDKSGKAFLKAVSDYQKLELEIKKVKQRNGRAYASSIANSNAYINKLLAIYIS